MKAVMALSLVVLAPLAAAKDYAAWARRNPDGAWTAAAETAVAASSLPQAVPADVEKFCPGYAARNPDERKVFWVGLLSIVARPESNFEPGTKFTEKFTDAQGNKVVSRGLLQISIESANQRRYSCGIVKAKDLHDPSVNLGCGVKILDAWVKTDNVIATWGTGSPAGGGHYWSKLREKNNYLPAITTFTRGLKVCTAGA